MKKKVLCLFCCLVLTANCFTSVCSAYYATTITKTPSQIGVSFKRDFEKRVCFEGVCPFLESLTMGCYAFCCYDDGIFSDKDYMYEISGNNGMASGTLGNLLVYNVGGESSGWSSDFTYSSSVSTKKIKHTSDNVKYKVYIRTK